MRTLVLLHGIAAGLAIATTIHMLVFLPKRSVAPRGTAWGFLATVIALYVLGWVSYPAFRTEIRFDLLQDKQLQWLANIFDVKEFLSIGALLISLAVGAATSTRRRIEPATARAMTAGLWFVLLVLVFNSVVGFILAEHSIL
jgi:hypothetical protein